VTRDSVERLAGFAARRKIGFTLISDEKSEVITAFGVRDDRYGTTGMYSAIARPTIFIVSADGIVRHRIDVDHDVPPPIDDVLALLASG
jgi:peroxiredoxin